MGFLVFVFYLLLITSTLIQSQENEFQFPEPKPIQLTKTLDIGHGNQAWVLDNVITPHDTQIIESAFPFDFVESKGYVFVYQNYSANIPREDWNFGLPPWLKEINVSLFQQMELWNRTQPFVENILQKPVRLERVQTDFIGSLDPMTPMKSRYCEEGRYFLSIFYHSNWKLNSYGHVSFYSESHNPNITDEPRLEITSSVHPHGLRGILWPSCHVTLFRGPSINQYKGIEKLTLWLNTKDEGSAPDVPTSITQSNADSKESMRNFRFPDLHRVINYTDCLTRTTYDVTTNKPIHVLDGVFNAEELKSWKRLLFRKGANSNEWDSSIVEDGDNVRWLCLYDVDDFASSDMWKRLQDVLAFVSNETEWMPYDVAVNYLKSYDNTRIHPDAKEHEVEYTLLLYLSEGLTPNDYAETNWVVHQPDDGVHGYLGRGGEVFETIAAVAPKFGRLAVFRNNVEHSAHPPTVSYIGGRFSFAVKVTRNLRLNYIKRLYEKLENLENMNKHYQRLNRQLMFGLQDEPTPQALTTEFLGELLQRVTDKVNEQRSDHFSSIEEQFLKST
nr:uncharacterized protein LOC100183956 isoform X2 [Ciona intestinalis]XP_018671966.1 uncharacterized protein LOC100183956 isoform X1 [Ciona intestinalis]|eukprot:XP_002121142.1 uncharacterized protein LOC100183956 isoform X2 [Ciona intestinalis]